MKSATAILIFSLCGAIDFAIGWFRWHTVAAGLVAAVCGLPLTLFLYLFWRGRDEGDQ